MSRNEPFESVPTANDHANQAISLSQALLAPRIVIEDTQPVLEAGTFAAKAISGQPVAVSSKVYCDGHDRLAVMLSWRQANSRRWHCVAMHSPGNDLWLAEFTPTEPGPTPVQHRSLGRPLRHLLPRPGEKVPRRCRGHAGAWKRAG